MRGLVDDQSAELEPSGAEWLAQLLPKPEGGDERTVVPREEREQPVLQGALRCAQMR